MKSTTLTTSYLLKDTLNRWLEQPSSPLARYIVAFLLSLAGVGMLVYLSLVERGLEAQIDSLGLNRAVIRQNLRAVDYAGGVPEPDPLTYSALSKYGEVFPVKFSFGRAQSNYGPLMAVGEYGDAGLRALAAQGIAGNEGVVFLSTSLPEGAPITADLGGMSVSGIVNAMPGILSIAGEDNMVLLPEGFNRIIFVSGCVDTTFFEKADDTVSIGTIVSEIEAMNNLQYPPGSYPAAPVISSAVKFAAELDAFREKQVFLTAILVAGVGGVIALVFGATAILEFRQSEFVCALLRSFGVGNMAILSQRLTEGLVIANGALLTALMLIPVGRHFLSGDIVSLISGFEWNSILPIFFCVNLGALISVIPLSYGIRRPIGEVLS